MKLKSFTGSNPPTCSASSNLSPGQIRYRNSEKGKAAAKKRTRRWAQQHRRDNIERDLARNRESQKKATMRGLPWGVVEDSFLLDNAGKMGMKEIAAELGRSIKSCEIRLYRLRQYEQNAVALAPPPQRLASKKDVPGG